MTTGATLRSNTEPGAVLGLGSGSDTPQRLCFSPEELGKAWIVCRSAAMRQISPPSDKGREIELARQWQRHRFAKAQGQGLGLGKGLGSGVGSGEGLGMGEVLGSDGFAVGRTDGGAIKLVDRRAADGRSRSGESVNGRKDVRFHGWKDGRPSDQVGRSKDGRTDGLTVGREAMQSNG